MSPRPQFILAMQTIVSRETSPLDPAVVTVGSIHGRARENIIPDEVKMQLTVRTYKEEVRRRKIASIGRMAKNIALAAGIPAERAVAGKSRPGLARHLQRPRADTAINGAMEQTLGPDHVVKQPPVMSSEGFLPLRPGGKGHSELVFLARGRRSRGSGEERTKQPELRCRRSIPACLRPLPARPSGRASRQ